MDSDPTESTNNALSRKVFTINTRPPILGYHDFISAHPEKSHQYGIQPYKTPTIPRLMRAFLSVRYDAIFLPTMAVQN